MLLFETIYVRPSTEIITIFSYNKSYPELWLPQPCGYGSHDITAVKAHKSDPGYMCTGQNSIIERS